MFLQEKSTFVKITMAIYLQEIDKKILLLASVKVG